MTEKLKPCPFCGGEAVLCTDGERMSTVECTSCGATIPWMPRLPKNAGENRDIQVVSVWNMRTLSPLETALRNELEDAEAELLQAFNGDFKHTLIEAKNIEKLLRRVKAEMKGSKRRE